MAISSVLKYEAYQTLAFSSITTSFVAIGSPIAASARIFKIVNNTDGDMIISTDGTTLHDFVPAGSYTTYDAAANSGAQAAPCRLPSGTQFYVKYSTAPSKNSVYLITLNCVGE